ADGVAVFQRRIDAAQAGLKAGKWSLTDVRETSPGSQVMRSDSMTLPTLLPHRRDVERVSSPPTDSPWGRPVLSARTAQRGFCQRRLSLAPAAAAGHSPALCGDVDPHGRLFAEADALGRAGDPGDLGRAAGLYLLFPRPGRGLAGPGRTDPGVRRRLGAALAG